MIQAWDPLVGPILRSTLKSTLRSTKNLSTLIGLPRKIRNFEPRVRIRVERPSFLIRTVETPKEFAEVLRLRYEVFEREFRGNRFPIGWDTDEYDLLSDHLVIIDTRTGKIVGNYRVISSTYSKRFYSDSEFNISDFLELPGTKLELGRACIHPDYRTGAVMSLLWRGVLEYVRKVDAQYLFGCTSLKTINPFEIAWLLQQFKNEGRGLGSLRVPILDEYRIEDTQIEYRCCLGTEPTAERKKQLIPALLTSYFRAGAHVSLDPALDRYFKCIDLFTVLDTSRMTESYGKKFGVLQGSV